MILHSMNNTLIKLPIRSIGLPAMYNLCSTEPQLRRHLILIQRIKNEMLFVQTEGIKI